MGHRAIVPLLAAGVLAVTACSGSDDVVQEASNTTLGPGQTVPAEPSDTAVPTAGPSTTGEAGDPTSDSSTPDTTSSIAPNTSSSNTTTSNTSAPNTTTADTSAPGSSGPATGEPASTDQVPLGAAAATPAGSAYFNSEQSFDDTVAAATEAIEGNEALTLVATIDHAANAGNAGLDLPPTTELVFGNPMIGTPLMQSSPSVGIDLPQKLLVYELNDGSARVMWNTPDYLAGRHGLTGVDEQLDTVGMALAALARTAAGLSDDAEPVVTDAPPESSAVGAGLIEQATTGTAREAADRLLGAIESNPGLILVAEIDHAANAASVGLELPPIIEVVFGNPNLGTPLMRAGRTIGIDLPQKMLFVESADGVTITYNDPAYLAQRHEIDPSMPPVPTVAGALDQLSSAAAG